MSHLFSISGCISLNISIAVVYHGTTSEEIRPYIYKLARQFYSSSLNLQIISYTILEQRRFQLSGRKVHPFKEVLNKATTVIHETDETSMFRDIASFFGSDNFLHIILIEDGTELTKIPSQISENVANASHIYRVQKDKKLKQHVTVLGGNCDAETVIKLDRWDILAYNGAALFPAICKGNSFIIQNKHTCH